MLIERLHKICENESCKKMQLKKSPVDCHNACTICIAKNLLGDYPDKGYEKKN